MNSHLEKIWVQIYRTVWGYHLIVFVIAAALLTRPRGNIKPVAVSMNYVVLYLHCNQPEVLIL